MPIIIPQTCASWAEEAKHEILAEMASEAFLDCRDAGDAWQIARDQFALRMEA